MRHISDEDIVRYADGELSSQRAAEVSAHLEACWECRARMEEFQTTITGFVRIHHAALDAKLPTAAGSRALLRARLAQMGSESRTPWWNVIFSLRIARVAVVCVPMIVIGMAMVWFLQTSQKPASALFDASAAPNRNLTPGATRQVTIQEVCAAPREEVISNVSVSLRRKVFQEYGMVNARAEDYEIDYLIAPQLGGAQDIRNLWPEPYRARVWNAHVKDALEERLHEMVCSGQLDLSTAQHEIASDWIAAYKKYFHTPKPLPRSS